MARVYQANGGAPSDDRRQANPSEGAAAGAGVDDLD